MRIRHFNALLLALVAVMSACAPVPQPDPAVPQSQSKTARPETVAMLRADLEAERHPSDGGGRAWLNEPIPKPSAGSPARFDITFETGPEGIAEGGMVFLLISPFWGWSPPQLRDPSLPGFVEVSTAIADLDLDVQRLDKYLIGIGIGGRALAPGEQLRIVYGAGDFGARADRYAESESPLWISVDGNGDGVRKNIAEQPTITVTAGSPELLVLHLPGSARPGEMARLRIAVLDGSGNAGVTWTGTIQLTSRQSIAGFPISLTMEAKDGGLKSIEFETPAEGFIRVTGKAGSTLRGESNPMLVSDSPQQIFWADLHGHSALSDGSATPSEYYSYARDVAGLDCAVLTDHDHWGVEFLDQSPEMWQRIQETTAAFNEEGEFVTLLGFEWTSWLHGHRHVLYFGDRGDVFSSIDPASDTPTELWQALEGLEAMTIAHHSAGGPIATNWDFAPDPRFETVTEISSVHGSSEAPDSPHPIYNPVPGNFARDALDRGYVLGFVGSGDSHDGHPGLAHLGAPSGGAAAVISDELSREAVHEALRQRRCYATNGPRIILRFAVDGHPMGALVAPTLKSDPTVFIKAIGTAEIERVDLIRSGSVAVSIPGDGGREFSASFTISGIEAGEYAYVRIIQTDDGAAWSSPVFFGE